MSCGAGAPQFPVCARVVAKDCKTGRVWTGKAGTETLAAAIVMIEIPYLLQCGSSEVVTAAGSR